MTEPMHIEMLDLACFMAREIRIDSIHRELFVHDDHEHSRSSLSASQGGPHLESQGPVGQGHPLSGTLCPRGEDDCCSLVLALHICFLDFSGILAFHEAVHRILL